MTTSFDERKKGFEAKYRHDQETRFKITARRNKLLGLWAAGEMGLEGADAEAYAREVVAADFEQPGDADVVGKILRDFADKGLEIGEHRVRKEMDRLAEAAREQILAEARPDEPEKIP